MLIKPINFAVCRRSVETIKIKNLVPNYMIQHEETIKQDMANKIVHKLIADGFITLNCHGSLQNGPIEGVSEIEAWLYVIRPWN